MFVRNGVQHPGRDGLVLPLDVAEFELLAEFGYGELPPMPYVKRAWLHLVGTTELISLFRVGEPGQPNCGDGKPVSKSHVRRAEGMRSMIRHFDRRPHDWGGSPC